jgi:hypothetical protein
MKVKIDNNLLFNYLVRAYAFVARKRQFDKPLMSYILMSSERDPFN